MYGARCESDPVLNICSVGSKEGWAARSTTTGMIADITTPQKRMCRDGREEDPSRAAGCSNSAVKKIRTRRRPSFLVSTALASCSVVGFSLLCSRGADGADPATDEADDVFAHLAALDEAVQASEDLVTAGEDRHGGRAGFLRTPSFLETETEKPKNGPAPPPPPPTATPKLPKGLSCDAKAGFSSTGTAVLAYCNF